jgi:hypothetical protein
VYLLTHTNGSKWKVSMKTSSARFQVGSYRPIYLWGGPGTIRMNRLKFMEVPVDEFAHHEVHSPEGAHRVVHTMGHNWVHLMYDWGFPPEIELEDWDVFEQAAAVYHEAGAKVFAYIQTSNCVYEGSFRKKDWYAADPHGEKVTYFTYSGRYMACLSHPEWRRHLQDLIAGAIERGADGIFFDNIFQGDQPTSLFGTWLGNTGCHCSICQRQYLEEIGEPIPTLIQPKDPDFARYLRWRANQVTQLIAEMGAYAKGLQPGTPVSANDFDPVLRDSYLVYGIDLGPLAEKQDIVMIEGFGLPLWEDQPKPRLANGALTIRTARAIVGDAAHLSILSYDVGIGFDPVYPARRYQQGIAEAAACGVSMTTKGTEYHDGTEMTVLTASQYAPIHAALGKVHTWLEAHAPLFGTERHNVAPVGLLYPGERLWLDWHRVAPLYFGAGQALTVEGIPWRVIQPGDSLAHVQAILAFDEDTLAFILPVPGVEAILVPEIASWSPAPPSSVGKSALLRKVVTYGVKAGLRAYSDSKLARGVMDRAGLPKIITQSPLYFVPERRAREALLDALPSSISPRLKAESPALIEVWEAQETLQIHVVNYAGHRQHVQIQFQSPVRGRVLSPDNEDTAQPEIYEGALVDVPLNVYKVLLIENP